MSVDLDKLLALKAQSDAAVRGEVCMSAVLDYRDAVAEDMDDLVAEIRALRARVEVLERVRAETAAYFDDDYEDAPAAIMRVRAALDAAKETP